MPKSISIRIIVFCYTLVTLYTAYWYFSVFKSRISYAQTLPLGSSEIRMLIFGILQIAVSIGITIGLLKLKKWAYRLGIVFGFLASVTLLLSIAQAAVALENVLPIVATVLLAFNKKKFYSAS